MPTISRFHGIVIRMYFSDHAPPHFRAVYSGDEAVIVIATGEILRGSPAHLGRPGLATPAIRPCCEPSTRQGGALTP